MTENTNTTKKEINSGIILLLFALSFLAAEYGNARDYLLMSQLMFPELFAVGSPIMLYLLYATTSWLVFEICVWIIMSVSRISRQSRPQLRNKLRQYFIFVNLVLFAWRFVYMFGTAVAFWGETLGVFVIRSAGLAVFFVLSFKNGLIAHEYRSQILLRVSLFYLGISLLGLLL